MNYPAWQLKKGDPAAEKTLHVKASETVLKNMASHLAMIAQILSEDAEEEREEQKNR